MIVFKYYFKIVRSFFPVVAVYSIIFIGIALMMSLNGNQDSKVFETSQTKIALINRDKESTLIQTFRQYIQQEADYIELNDDESELKDALFFRKVDYIMIVPQGFTKNFIKDNNVKIETMEVPDAYASIYSKKLMNKYLNTAKLYVKAGIDDQRLGSLIKKDLSIHSHIELTQIVQSEHMGQASSYYNFLNFILLNMIIEVVSMVIFVFNEEKIKNRNYVSAVSYQSMNRQLLLGNMTISFGIWLLYVIASCCLYSDVMLTQTGLLLILNSLVFVIFILVLSFLLTALFHKQKIVSSLATVIGLGTSFIAGAFVPQEYLAPMVLKIAHLTPSYWFITNNNLITQLSDFSIQNIQPIFINMGIIFCFVFICYILIQTITYFKTK